MCTCASLTGALWTSQGVDWLDFCLTPLRLAISEAFSRAGLNDAYEIVFIDDGSLDGSGFLSEALRYFYGSERIVLPPQIARLGLGFTYRHGTAAATGLFIALMDADFSQHPKSIPEFVEVQQMTRANVGTGTRYVPEGGVHGRDLRRKLVSGVAKFPAAVLLRQRLSKLTGIFHLYSLHA